MVRSVYIAGPEVFFPEAKAVGKRKVELCREYGFEGLFPLDNDVDVGDAGDPLDLRIYRANVALVARADIGIFNLTPFRGEGADPGTAFELGMFVGLGKPVFGYTNDARDLLARVAAAGVCTTVQGVTRDADGMSVEDFGEADNLMLTCSLALGGYPIVRTDVPRKLRCSDLSGFRACLSAARDAFPN